MSKLSNFFAHQPKKLFLTDALGASLSVFLLYGIVAGLESQFGMPSSLTSALALTVAFFAGYSFFCYAFGLRSAFYLRLIAGANLLYCTLTLCLLLYHAEQLKLFGWLYLLVEIAIVVCLAGLELKVAGEIK